MYRVGELAKAFKLSRTALLYYDKLGLLSPLTRTAGNYRQYSQNDYERLKQICIYREAGLSLEAIGEILNSSANHSADVLEQRLATLNEEISSLRQQQQFIIGLLGKDSLVRTAKSMTKEQWVSILRASGLDDVAMHKWHIEFEAAQPEAHSDFLQSLGIDNEEIAQIKSWSRADKSP